MEIFPAAFLVLAFWLIRVLRDPDNGYAVAVAMIPFGMFAAVSLTSVGGLSLLAANVLAGLTIGIGVLRYLGGMRTRPSVRLSAATLCLILFAVYAVISATLLVRLFSGEFLVFSLSRSVQGARVDAAFTSVLVPLRPGSSNISQTFYVVLGCGFFVAAVDFLRRRGLEAGESALRIAAIINILLGVVDMIGLDVVLEHIRTASYTLANEQRMGPFGRVIGGYSEPSSFGSASAIFFAYFASAYFQARRPRDAIIAILSAFFVVTSFSATGFLAAGVACMVLVWRGRKLVGGRIEQGFISWAIILICALTAALCAALALTPAIELADGILNRMIFSKADSLSGLERKAWAEGGLRAFRETWGLGAGVGSLRSNGLLPVYLGSVGLPGTLVFTLFLWFAIGRKLQTTDPVARRVYLSGRLGVLAQLAAFFISGTVPDPGLLLITCAAMSTAAYLSAGLQHKTVDGIFLPHTRRLASTGNGSA